MLLLLHGVDELAVLVTITTVCHGRRIHVGARGRWPLRTEQREPVLVVHVLEFVHVEGALRAPLKRFFLLV